jgi:hypothetical protein
MAYTWRPFPKKGNLNNDYMSISLFKFPFWGMGAKYRMAHKIGYVQKSLDDPIKNFFTHDSKFIMII